MLQRAKPLTGQPRLIAQSLPLRVAARARQEGLGPQTLGELERGLAPQLEPLCAAAQAVERGGRALAAPCGGGQLVLAPVALGEQRLEPFVGALALQRGCGSPPLDLAEPLL